MTGNLFERRFASRLEHRRERCVAAGPFGLRERVVRDLADQLGLEVEVFRIEHEEIAFGQTFE